ncbi:MAG TPA: DUF4089 domain-containing protein [Xanthobacteraceae bacterium]|jgi:hypothetical protein
MSKRAKTASKRTTKPSRRRVTRTVGAKTRSKQTLARARPAPDALDAFVDAAAHALALPAEPAWKGAIKTNLAVTLALAASFADFPLPDDAEPAPVFVA